jgi:hypothetical protein
MPTQDQIADMVEGACFYVDPTGLWLRILHADHEDGWFQGLDEDSGLEYRIPYTDVTLTNGERFMQLTEMPVPTA